MLTIRQRRDARTFLRFIPLALLLTFLLTPAAVRAQKSEEFDEYKIRFDAGWFYSYPSGTIRAQGDTYAVDLTQGLNFSSYSTFAGKVDWKFTHKNHFYVGVTLAKHMSFNAGYQVGTRLNVNNTLDRIGLDLTQKGPIAGLEFSF